MPEVNCGENEITLMVNTLQGNPSHMYVVGRHEDPQCVTRNDNKITIMHEQCGVTRERNVSQNVFRCIDFQVRGDLRLCED